jgi:hypothetical protein
MKQIIAETKDLLVQISKETGKLQIGLPSEEGTIHWYSVSVYVRRLFYKTNKQQLLCQRAKLGVNTFGGGVEKCDLPLWIEPGSPTSLNPHEYLSLFANALKRELKEELSLEEGKHYETFDSTLFFNADVSCCYKSSKISLDLMSIVVHTLPTHMYRFQNYGGRETYKYIGPVERYNDRITEFQIKQTLMGSSWRAFPELPRVGEGIR